MRCRPVVPACTIGAALLGLVAVAAAPLRADPAGPPGAAAVDARLRRMVEDDWAAQEKRLGRAAASTSGSTETSPSTAPTLGPNRTPNVAPNPSPRRRSNKFP